MTLSSYRDLEESPKPISDDYSAPVSPQRDPVTMGGCSPPGETCGCPGFMGYDDLCGNCGHNNRFHY